jgi:hypothetical protein
MDRARPLVSIIEAIAEELGDLGMSIDRLQTTLSPMLFEIARSNDYVRDVQMLDLISQRLGAMSSFMLSLNMAISPSCFVNSSAALRDLKLAALAERLTGAETDPNRQLAGDLDLF